MKMTLCRTKDRRYLAAAGRKAAPEGAEVVEPSRLNLGGLQAAIMGRRAGRNDRGRQGHLEGNVGAHEEGSQPDRRARRRPQ